MNNPVFVNELRQSLFRRRPLIAAIIWLIVAVGLMFRSDHPKFLESVTLYLPALALPLIVPTFSAGLFAKEYEQRTWQDLYLTRLTNAQVVWGKFASAFLFVVVSVTAFLPATFLALTSSVSDNPLFVVVATLTLGLKTLLSASLFVLIGMVCSRYCSTRRAALTCSYVALFGYGGFGMLTWEAAGADVSRAESFSDSVSSGGVYAIPGTGFMEGIHLTFSAVVGIGMIVLLWVSLSEQRGYRSSGAGDEGIRAWQPVRKQSKS